MYLAHQRDRWDHTAALLVAWSESKTSVDQINPYRRKSRAKTYLRPAELYAMQRSLERRKEKT
jgi:hypothetical protein